MKVFWDEFGPPVVAVLCFLAIAALVCALAFACTPDKIIYEFITPDGTVTFEVSSLDEHTDTYYRFTLVDGTEIVYYPMDGSTVRRTEIRY